MIDEIFPIVDDNGAVVGSATRKECHSGSMQLHPVVHLHVVDPDRRSVLLQQRARTKKIQPGAWDTAVGGHVDFGEDVHTALIRESREELGIDASDAEFVCKYVFQSSIERELVYVHFMSLPKDIKICANIDEVINVRFWSIEEIEAAMGSGILTPNFESEFIKIVKPKILSAL
ncbi:MAG: NUDIX domain-containing protein [Paramuribaculum sp.]|nr:NUDIX domain-containing protein [Paramuribaculum sp.]